MLVWLWTYWYTFIILKGYNNIMIIHVVVQSPFLKIKYPAAAEYQERNKKVSFHFSN